jgi:hypothetical protein
MFITNRRYSRSFEITQIPYNAMEKLYSSGSISGNLAKSIFPVWNDNGTFFRTVPAKFT